MEIETGSEDIFFNTVERYLATAHSVEKELSAPQASSSFLYAAAVYNALHIISRSRAESVDIEELVAEYVDIYDDMLRNAIEHYGSQVNQ
jgi:hypothetical protein